MERVLKVTLFQEILMWCGWTEYQALCLAPSLAGVLGLAVFSWGVGVVDDIVEAGKHRKRGERCERED